ncbi:MAG: tyrosine-type recombinase/integrase [Ruminococcus sp.]|jgi:site-specific recombinase XerD|nr:tyrosine-type recombinase/integrase [Ruminococcus sp.]
MKNVLKSELKNCPDFLGQFFTYQRVILMKSEKTAETYFYDLRLFLRFLKRLRSGEDKPLEEFDIKDITAADLEKLTKLEALEYLNFLAADRGNNARTRKRKLAALNTLYKCLYKDLGLVSQNIVKDIDYPKLPITMPKYLSLEESKKLLGAVGGTEDDKNFIRDYCIVTLFVNCGMRLSELTGLNLTSVDLDSRTMRLLGKGNKERIIHINDACAFALSDYFAVRPECDTDALFISRNHRRITNRRVQQIIENLLKRVGLDGRGLSVHKLRHTAATLMYQYGNADPILLKEILGHKSVATTEIYTHINNERITKAMDDNPLANIKKGKRA